MVVVPTGKIDFGPACASAAPLCTAVPASASAPVAKMVLRSTLLIGVSLYFVFCSCCRTRIYRLFEPKWTCFALCIAKQERTAFDEGAATAKQKRPASPRAFRIDLNEAQCLISGGSLPPLAASLAMTCLCSQIFMLAESLLSPV